METIRELFELLRSRKKLWLFPMIVAIVAIGSILVLAQGSVFAPFIYTLF